MKEILRNVYIQNLELVMQPKFNSENKNIWAVAFLRYVGGMVRWTKNEHQNMDRETRKVMTKNKELQPGRQGYYKNISIKEERGEMTY